MNDIKVTYNRKVMENVDKCIDKAVESWQAARKYTQVALVATLCAKYHSGDAETAVKRMNRIVAGAQGANTNAIVEWGVLMGYTVDAEGKGFSAAPENDVIKSRAGAGFKGAKELHWWSLKPIKPFEGYDLMGALQSLVKKANQMDELKGKDEDKGALIKIDPVLLSELENLTS
jgi:hypothetical protein